VDPSTTFAAGRQNAVDVLVGSNKDEAFFAGARTTQQFQEQARARWGALADQFLALYPHATDAEAQASSAQTSNDGTFWVGRLYADYQVLRGNKAYLYFFSQNPPAPAGQPPFPAAHAAEVPYVFNNLGELPLFPDRSDPKLAGASAPDRKVADQMSSYWASFARTGDPNGAGLPVWQEHQVGASDRAIILDADPSSERLPSKARLELYDKLYAQMRAGR
jgi:para-nitrobenzyl esterase